MRLLLIAILTLQTLCSGNAFGRNGGQARDRPAYENRACPRFPQYSGYDGTAGPTWKAVYDGLGRRVQTNDGTTTNTYYYDPQCEFLELGHDHNGRVWNVYGPDRNGVYGGLNGCGGLEAIVPEGTTGTDNEVFCNYFGDVLTAPGGTMRRAAVVDGYGVELGSGVVNGQYQPEWRSRYLDPTGFYYLGARYYEPHSGRFLSADPLGHDASMDLYAYCNGDPVNGFDADGRKGSSIEGSGLPQVELSQRPDLDPMGYDYVNYGDDLSGRFANHDYVAPLSEEQELSNFLDMVPGVSAVKGLVQGVTGFNFVTGKYLSDGDQAESFAMGVIGLVPGGSLESSAVRDVDMGLGSSFSNQMASTEMSLAARMPAAEGVEGGGTGMLHYYDLPTGPHFSVEVLGGDAVHTEQVITSRAMDTTMSYVEGATPTASMPFSLSNVSAAQQLQLSRVGADLGTYNRLSNSCLTNARDILNAGGANLPASNLRLGIWAKTTFGF